MPTSSLLSFDSIISFGSKFSFYCKDGLALERVEKRPIGSLKLTRGHTTISVLACFSHEPNVFITWLQQFVNCYFFDNLRYAISPQPNLHSNQISLVSKLATVHSPVHTKLKPILKCLDAPDDTYEVNSVKRVRFDANSYVQIIDESSNLSFQKSLSEGTVALSDVKGSSVDNAEIQPSEQILPNLSLTKAGDLSHHSKADLNNSPKPEDFYDEIDIIDATIKKLRKERKILKKQRNRSKLANLSTLFSRPEKNHDSANDEQVCSMNDTECILSHRSVISTSDSYSLKLEQKDLPKHNYNDPYNQISLKHKHFSFRHLNKIFNKTK